MFLASQYGSGYLKREKTPHSLATALLQDPIPSDVPNKSTISDVDTLISLEQGGAMRISILKLDSTNFDVVLTNTANLKDLKLAITLKVNDFEQSKMGHRQISWKHVWANFCLLFHNQKLLNDYSRLQDLASGTTLRCSLFLLSYQRTLRGMQGERNTVSSMA